MSKKTISTLLQLIIFLSLGIALMIWRYNAIEPQDKADMFAAFRNIRWGWAGPVLVIGFLSHYFRALRWKLLLRPLDIYPTTANTTFAVLIGYLANILVPRMGEVAKCTVLAKYEDVPAEKLVGTIIAERAFDLSCLILILFLTLFIQFDIIYPFAKELYLKIFTDGSGNFYWLRIGIALIVLAGMIICCILLARKLKGSKVGKIIAGIGEGLKAILKVKQKGLFFLYTFLVWAMYIALVIIGFWALPETEHITLLAAFSIITFGSVGMIVTPGGIGAYPVIVAEVLLLYGINAGIGFAYGWVSWTAQTVVVIVLGLGALILLPLYNRKKHEAQKRNHIG